MAADLRVVALGWSQDHVELFFGGIEAGRQRLAELLHAIRTERLACGHLAGELQGEDGGTRWCAGCEREAGIRAEAEARVVEAAAQAMRMAIDTLVTDLFTNSFGEEAARLVMVDAANRDLGGWCRTAVRDRIRAALSRARKGE